MEKSVSEQKSVRANGRTVEEAIQDGLAELGVARDQVEVELLNIASGDPARPVVVQLTISEEMEAAFAPTNVNLTRGTVEQTTPTPPSIEPENLDDVPNAAKNVLENLLRGMGIRSQVVIHQEQAEDDAPAFILDIVGADLGILIGRRGETLRDLEYLTRLIVTSKTKSSERFGVDVEGYRARRERVLRDLAKRMADRVKSSHQPITLEAMPPNERRIVHITLKEHPSVKTQSIGEGERRRVMILPK